MRVLVRVLVLATRRRSVIAGPAWLDDDEPAVEVFFLRTSTSTVQWWYDYSTDLETYKKGI